MPKKGVDIMRVLAPTKSIAQTLAIVALSGCYSASHLIQAPQGSDTITVNNNASRTKLPSFVSSINVKTNDAGANTSADFERRFLGHLQQANYFSDVMYGVYSKRPEPPYADISLNVNEDVDTNSGANIVKGVFTGLTLFLLAPVLPATFDYSTDFALSAKWPDGTQRDYKASCTASAYGTWPYMGAAEKFKISQNDCTEKCLNSVINQLTSDKAR